MRIRSKVFALVQQGFCIERCGFTFYPLSMTTERIIQNLSWLKVNCKTHLLKSLLLKYIHQTNLYLSYNLLQSLRNQAIKRLWLVWENCDNNKGCLDCIDCDVAYECGLADIVINVMSDKNILFYVTILKMSIYLNNNM